MTSMLFIGHPGHELMVHGWLEAERPVVCVVTDGGGQKMRPRIDSSTAILAGAGALRGRVYAPLSDAAAYASILARDPEPWVAIARTLASEIVEREIDRLVADALEGYNPVHDMTRYVADVVVALVAKESGRKVENLEFALFEEGESLLVTPSPSPPTVHLDDRAWERKQGAAESYAELRPEFERTLAHLGVEGLRKERFHPVPEGRDGAPRGEKPFYERFGEERVRTGRYGDVIRYVTHLRPLVDSLWSACGLDRSATRAAS